MNGLALALCLFAPLTGAADETVILILKDGTELAGEPAVKDLEIDTDFGSATVELDQIASIEFGEPDVIETRGGLQLTGDVQLKSVRLKVDGKKRSTKTGDIARWIAVSDGKRLDAADVAGEWVSSFGPMVLEQSGRQVTGTYGYDESTLEGTITGNTLSVTYGRGGEATFELWPGGDGMGGPWSSGERSGTWGAYRKQPMEAEPEAGEITTGQTESGLRYHLRVPKDYDPAKDYDAICILHGSNMSARDYVATFPAAWPELAEQYVIVGFDGEKMNGNSTPEAQTFNYSYINFSGDGVGPPFAHRQSPALVAEGLSQLSSELGLGRWFVGGHSQGAWLTYPVAMFYPELVAGAFPISGGMLVQCEPTSFNDLEAQRGVAFAPVHGTNDNVVAFSSGEAGVNSLLDGDFPALHFFTDDGAAHMFARLPVDRAIRWLDTMTSGDATRLGELAQDAAEREQWRDVAAALLAAEGLDGADDAGLSAAGKALERAASKAAGKIEAKVLANKNGDWMEDFLPFRDDFAFAPAAAKVMDAYRVLREEHQDPADKLFWKQRSEQDKDEQLRMRKEIVETYYASSWYKLVKGWLDN